MLRYSSEYVESFVSSEYTYDYGTEEAEAKETISRSITCDESGKWNGQEDYELRFEKCEGTIKLHKCNCQYIVNYE